MKVKASKSLQTESLLCAVVPRGYSRWKGRDKAREDLAL